MERKLETMSDDVHFPRHMETVLDETVANARVVYLIGPRQVGKTTLVRDLYGEGRYITLDDPGVLAVIHDDPLGQLESLISDLSNAPLVIDEAQRSRELALAIKVIVDRNRRKGQFVLTGSSNVFIADDAMDSLAGRVRVLKLWPLMVAEIRSAQPNRFLDWASGPVPDIDQVAAPERLSRTDYIDLLIKGGFPEVIDMPLVQCQRHYREMINLIVSRDVADMIAIRKADSLRQLIDQLAVRTAQEINVASLASHLGINRATVDQYLDLLERLSLVIRLGAWSSREAQREIKHAKLHFVDTGMAAALRHLKTDSFNAGNVNAPAFGHFLETFVFNEILRSLELQRQDYRLYHWRSPDRREVDMVVDGVDSLVGIEVKASSSVAKADFRHLQWFGSKQGPGGTRSFTGIVFYLGQHKLTFGNNCFALPVSTLWSDIDI